MRNNYGIKNIIFFDVALLIQIFLGIITLTSGVEIKYASLHQLGSIFVLTTYLIILNYLFIEKRLSFLNILLFDIAILLQIFLGVITLVSGVEIKYASLHQLGSIFVLSSYLLILYKNSNLRL